MMQSFEHNTNPNPSLTALGMMSGTSLDGVDLAIIQTNGHQVQHFGAWASYNIPDEMREALRGLMFGKGDALKIERNYTGFVAELVKRFLFENAMSSGDIDVMGFHGQTIIHRPQEGITWQLGNPSLLSEQIGIKVVADFRRRDMAAGGQGAPLVPIYHAALAADLPKPVAIVNIGGVANVTYIGKDGALLAWDTGTGNALINDWVKRHTGEAHDEAGRYAASGLADNLRIADALKHPYFTKKPPKSLDRNAFSLKMVAGMTLQDGAATLTGFTVEAIAAAQAHFPEAVTGWLICGGGRHNQTMMQALARRTNQPVNPVETVSWRGDALEAEAFAFLAVRALHGLPITFPSTTGVTHAVTGGGVYTVTAKYEFSS